MDKEGILEESIRYLQKFYKNYSFDRMLPLWHGTSTYHYAQMKHSGYLSPRGTRWSNWEQQGNYAPSQRSLVYFASSFETLIPNKSAHNAHGQIERWIVPFAYKDNKIKPTEQDEIKWLADMGYAPIPFDFKKDLTYVYLRLDKIDKYKHYMVRDEDENFQWFMDRSNYMSKDFHDNITFCHKQIDWQVIIIFNCMWYLFDKDREIMFKILSALPESIRSFYSNDTVAFTTSIDINDLKPYSEKDYYALTASIREKLDNACTEQGEEKLKRDYAKGRVSDDTLKEFIKTVQIPRLKKLLA